MSRKPNNALIAYLYAIQGVILSLPSTVVLTYSKLPDYKTLSLFALCLIPFAFKFISAPLLETYTSNSYGRRKTWIVISYIMASALIYLMSFYTADEYESLMAWAFVVIIFCVSLGDISTDALGVKQLKDPDRVGFLQAAMQQTGGIFGSLVFIKLVSSEFGQSLGFAGPIMSVGSYFRVVSLVTLLPTLLIHLKYEEELLGEERTVKNSVWVSCKQYVIFFKFRNSLCRQALLFIFYLQGTNVFVAGFPIQLIKNGFSKETLTSISNIVTLPVLTFTFLFSTIKLQGRRDSLLRIVLLLRVSLQIGGIILKPSNAWEVGAFSLMADVLSICCFIMDTGYIGSIPNSAYSGMFITMLNSTRNLGNNHYLQLRLIDWVGFEKACTFGIGYSLMVALGFKSLRKWVENGEQIGSVKED